MNTAVTVLQVILAFLFTVGGVLKLAVPYAKYSNIPGVSWAKEFKPEHVRLLGLLELCGGIGLAVPLFLPALIMLIPLAAVGMALYMSGAMATHLRRSEYLFMALNLLFFLAPALFVAYGRLVGFAA